MNLWKNRLRRMALEVRHLRLRETCGSESLELMEERNLMWRTLMRLPDRQRACVVLRYYVDLPEQEVADTLGCSLGTVKSQTSRALAKLRREVEHED